MKYIRLEKSRPSQIREMLEESPAAYVPVGALEWHAEHNPLGLRWTESRRLVLRSGASFTRPLIAENTGSGWAVLGADQI